LIYLWRLVLTAVAVFVAWQIVATGISRHFIGHVRDGDASAVEQALTWQPSHPLALTAKARQRLHVEGGDPMPLLREAYTGNPTDPVPVILAAGLLADDEQFERSDALMEAAVALAPATPSVHRDAAAYWATRGELERTVAHISKALEADIRLRGELFPVLITLGDNPQLRAPLEPIAASPPNWWNRFFAEAAVKMENLDALRWLYNLRRASTDAPLSAEERAAYVSRLQRDQRIDEAYVVWVNGLSAREQEELGLLFNGSFELPLSQKGFGWRSLRNDHAMMRQLTTAGTSGNQALRIQFRAHDERFHHLVQPLFLDPGTYQLTGRVRSDSFESKGGLRWQIRCLAPTSAMLALGPRVPEMRKWEDFELDFEVPEGCTYQQVMLVSAGRLPFELKLQGDIWFDDLRIIRVQDPEETQQVEADQLTVDQAAPNE